LCAESYESKNSERSLDRRLANEMRRANYSPAISVTRGRVIANNFPRDSQIYRDWTVENGNAREKFFFLLRESEVKIIRESTELCVKKNYEMF